MARSTGNAEADRAVVGMWLVDKGLAKREDVEAVIRQDLAGKSREEVEAIRDAIKNSISRPAVLALCGECSHPRSAHQPGDDPVSPGTCTACTGEDEWHDFQVAICPGRVEE